MYKKIIKGKKAVLFDLDGTLIDSGKIWRRANINILHSFTLGSELYDEFEEGTSISQKWNAIYKDLPDEAPSVEELVKRVEDEFIRLLDEKELVIRPGFWTIGKELKHDKELKFGLTTNTSRKVTDAVLKKLNLENVFDVTICGDEVRKYKPDPEIYRKAAKQMGVRPKQVLVFEDSVVGVTSAIKAKMDTIVVWNGETAEKAYPKNVLGFITDFTALIGTFDTTWDEEFEEYVKHIIELKEKRSKPQ